MGWLGVIFIKQRIDFMGSWGSEIMVKRDQIESKIKGYADENKLGALEAFYMWSKGISSQTIAGVLANKYGTAEGFDSIWSDINSFGIRGPSDRIETTNEEIGVVIREEFRKHQQVLLDKIVENLAMIRKLESRLLLAMINSSLFDNERIRIDDLKLAYRSIFREPIKDRDLMETLSVLEKIGIVYIERGYGRIDNIIIPEHVYAIQSQIEAKLPKIVVTEEEEEH